VLGIVAVLVANGAFGEPAIALIDSAGHLARGAGPR
jgi:hypothetical protein